MRIPAFIYRAALVVVFAAAQVASSTPTVRAAIIDWDGSSSTSYTTNGNWTPSGDPANNLTSDIARFGSIGFTNSPTLNASRSVNGLQFIGTGNFTFSGSGTNVLSIGGSGIDNQGTSGTKTIGASLALGANQSFTNSGTLVITNLVNLNNRVLTLTGTGASGSISGNISGIGGSIVKTGTGTWTLSGTNSYTGTTSFDGGVLSIAASNNLGTGALSFDGGTLQTTNAGAITINRPISFDAGYGTIDVSNAGGNTTLSGQLSGAGGFTKTGDGTLTITGTAANTFAGVTTVLDGTLALNGGGGAANNALIVGNIVVGDNVNSAGTANLTIGSTGQISNSSTVTVNSSGIFAVQTALEEVGVWDVRGGTITSSGAGQIWVGSGGVVSSGNVQGTISASTNLANGLAQFNIGNGSQAVDLRVTGVISDSEGTQNPLTKIGTGTLEFAAANTYGGGTTVSAGTLYVTNASGSATGTGTVTVASGATLAGTGRIASTVTGAGAEVTIAAGGHIAPGVNAGDGANAGVGTLTIVAQNVDMSGTYDWQVGGAQTTAAANTGGSGSFRDYINVTGSLAFNDATIRIDDTASFSGFNPAGNYSWLIATGSTGASVTGTTTFDTSQFSFSGGFFSLGVAGNNIYLNYSAVPEPSTWAMGLLALAAGGFYVQRRRRQARSL